MWGETVFVVVVGQWQWAIGISSDRQVSVAQGGGGEVVGSFKAINSIYIELRPKKNLTTYYIKTKQQKNPPPFSPQSFQKLSQR